MNKTKLTLVALLVIAVFGYITLDLGQYLTLEYAQSQLSSIQDYKNENFAQTALIYFIGYVIATGLSIPGAIIITYEIDQSCLCEVLILIILNIGQLRLCIFQRKILS